MKNEANVNKLKPDPSFVAVAVQCCRVARGPAAPTRDSCWCPDVVYTLAWNKSRMSTELDELIRKAESLSPEDRLRLLEHLSRRVSPERAQRQWREIRGAAPYPLVGKDAQTWVSRNRREGDEHRLRND